MAELIASNDPCVRSADTVLRLLFGRRYADTFAIEFWDGSSVEAKRSPKFTLKVQSPSALRYALRPPVDLNAGRAFASGLLDCEGNVEAAIDLLHDCLNSVSFATAAKAYLASLRLPSKRLSRLREAHLRGRVHSITRDRKAIAFHYDLPIDFYRTFLGNSMVYSCAYFDDGIRELDEAQYAKIDYLLRKLRVRPGERLLDIGCGWGALVVRAAQRFGANVLGVTLSRSQYEEGQRLLAATQLSTAAIEFTDYRDLSVEPFDKIVSVGMFEHVGKNRLSDYFARAYGLLRPGGLFLNHGIAEQSPGRKGGKAHGFINRFVFPDGELVAIGDAIALAERVGFELRDVENLREHYMHTLRAWVANLERNRLQAITAAGEEAYTVWRLYMSGSAQGFRTGHMGLFQTLFSRPQTDGSAGLPATRRDLYSPAHL